MKRTNTALCALGLAVSALWSASALAQGAPKGDTKAAEGKVSMCIGCHGIPLYQTVYPEVYKVPKIAGQSPEYIMSALRAYRTGERSHPSMQGIARSMSDKDMADVAAYYGGESRQAPAAPAGAKK
jgi:cytochrome c553